MQRQTLGSSNNCSLITKQNISTVQQQQQQFTWINQPTALWEYKLMMFKSRNNFPKDDSIICLSTFWSECLVFFRSCSISTKPVNIPQYPLKVHVLSKSRNTFSENLSINCVSTFDQSALSLFGHAWFPTKPVNVP